METMAGSNIDRKIKKEVKQVLNKLIKSQEKGDIGSFAECFAHDVALVHIGTDADEVWYNWDDFYQLMKKQLSERKGITINHKNTTVRHNKNRDVAWYFQLLDRCPETKGDDVCIEGFRHTGVMEKRNGQWMIVQSHISFPA
ncbi:MAG: nuclear transport factor 2 family protein [Chlorobi bacterium]|nr:nuclear transport factor 2 family protein [Chlorobiota bacterium]